MTGKAVSYVGKILDVALANAQAIVVAMTPVDEARLRPKYIEANIQRSSSCWQTAQCALTLLVAMEVSVYSATCL